MRLRALLLLLPLVALSVLAVEDAIFEEELNGKCKQGFGGPNCDPICDKKLPIIRHTQMDGDMVVFETSRQCDRSVQFPVDASMSSIRVEILAAGKNSEPYAKIYGPNGIQLIPPKVLSPDHAQQFLALYDVSGAQGQYNVTLNSMELDTCSLVVKTVSSITINGGFVTNVHSDRIQRGSIDGGQGVGTMPTQDTPSYFAFEASGLDDVGSATDISFYRRDMSLPNTYKVTRRYHCTASSIMATPFSCTVAGGDYVMKIRGSDSAGNEWQRMYGFFCNANASLITTPAPGVTTQRPIPPTSCENDGVIIDSGYPNATCWCSPKFTGNRCQYRICFNGGYYGDDNQCVCNPGYSGDFCESIGCPNRPTEPTKPTKRAFVYVVRGSTSMESARQGILSSAQNALLLAQLQDEDMFEKFTLVVYNNHAILSKNDFDDKMDFFDAINNTKFTDDASCGDNTFENIYVTLTSTGVAEYPTSPIFVFSNARPDDGEATKDMLVDQLGKYRGQVNFIVVHDNTTGCNLNEASPQYEAMRYLAAYSQGLVIKVAPKDIGGAVGIFIESITAADVVLSNDHFVSCNNAPKFQSVFMDESDGRNKSMYVIGTGKGFKPIVISPLRQTLTPKRFGNHGELAIYKYKAPIRGNYLISVSTSDGSACQYRVLEKNWFDTVFGVSRGINDDMYTSDPVYNHTNALVVRMRGIYGFMYNPDMLYAEATVWTNDPTNADQRVALYTSSGQLRRGCSFNLFFGFWTCMNYEQILYVTVFIDDKNGFTVERTMTTMCRPRILPPSMDGSCKNGGVPDKEFANNTCICPPGFQGNHCENIICQNNGNAHSMGYCTCRPGFAGRFCEIAACVQTNTHVFEPNNKAITFLVHDSLFMRTAIDQMLADVSRMIYGFEHQHPEWIRHYILISFDDQGYDILADTRDPVDFVVRFAAFRDRNQHKTGFSCDNLHVFEALHNALNSSGVVGYEGGIIYTFLNGLPAIDMDNYQNLMEQSILTSIQLNFVEMSGSPCGKSLKDTKVQLLYALAAGTGGQYKQAMSLDAGKVLLSIPYEYKSSFIYENYYDDCSKPTSFYFPIDAQTQGFTANIIGDTKGRVNYKYPIDGRIAHLHNEVTLYNSVGLASRMMLVTRPCDEGFIQMKDNICVWISTKKTLLWQDAKQECEDHNAALPIVFDSGDDNDYRAFIGSQPFWLGLNDVDKIGVWNWATRGNSGLTLNATGYTNWAKGQPYVDQNKRCVYSNGTSGWVVGDCAQSLPFMCIKNSYDDTYIPGALGRAPLPTGMWKMTLQTYSGPCMVKIHAQSGIRVQNAYVTHIHDDFGSPFLLPGNKTENRIISHVSGLEPPTDRNADTGALQFAQIYESKDMQMLAGVQYYPRSDCLYDYISRPFHCTNNFINVISNGIDAWGNAFQRINPVLCIDKFDSGKCENNGVMDQKAHACICPPNFFGERCEIPVCLHGGRVEGFRCDCNYGYTGQFCQIPQCTRNHEQYPYVDTPYNKTFIVAFDGSQYGLQANVISSFSKLMNDVLAKASGVNMGWFNKYVGVVFYDSTLSQIIMSKDAGTFIKNMAAELQAKTKPSTSSKRPIFSALEKVFRPAYITTRSQAFLITGGLPNDLPKFEATLDALSRKHIYVNTIIMGDTNLPGQAPYTDPSFEKLSELTYISGGGVYQMPSYDMLDTFLVTDVGTLFDNYYISSKLVKNCSSATEYIQVNSHSTLLTFDLFAKQAAVTIHDPLGAPHLAVKSVHTKTNALYLIQNKGNDNKTLVPGLWTVTVNNNVENPGACLINVRGVDKKYVYVAYSQDLMTDNGLHSDATSLAPKPLISNAVVVKSTFGTAQYVQIYGGQDRKLLFASPLVQRLRCQYQFISTESFWCARGLNFFVVIDGIDELGFPYRRQVVGHCIDTNVRLIEEA